MFFRYFDQLQTLMDQIELIPNIMVLCGLLLVRAFTSATPETSFSLARPFKTWKRRTMTQKHFTLSVTVNVFYKNASVRNNFIAKNNESYSAFEKFSEMTLFNCDFCIILEF